MSSLASIQRIETVSPIEGADRIEKVTMEGLGWNCVVMKGDFKPGNLCIFVQIDTIVPKKLLDWSYSGDEVVRLRTIKLKKQLSQGLVLPISILEHYVSHFDTYPDHVEFTDGTGEWKTLGIGVDISEPMKIQKYEKSIPAAMQGLVRGGFPADFPKTDEERLQNDIGMLDKLKDIPTYVTLKLNGTSLTTYSKGFDLHTCSRNNDLKEGESVYWRMVRKYSLETLLPDMYALQGEVCGPGIQENMLGLAEHDLFIFNVWELHNDGPAHKVAFPANKNFVESLGMKFVPVLKAVEDGSILFPGGLQEALDYSSSLNYNSGKPSEGIVVRSFDQTVSFKVVSNRYLLKEEE